MKAGRSDLLFVASLVGFTAVFASNAWVVDDAYISFRTVDNWLNGYGLTWNVDERVQAYSHPLWLLLVSALAWLTSDVFYTSIFASYACCIAAFGWLHARSARSEIPRWSASLLVVLVTSSKAAFDYTSSGLENPLSYLIAALFFGALLSRPQPGAEPSASELRGAVLLAALAFVTRYDSALLYAPALLWLAAARRRSLSTREVAGLALAASPALAWLLFSTVYYGTPFPNTFYAKSLHTGLSLADRTARGAQYVANAVRWDPALVLVVLGAAIAAARRRSPVPLLAVAGAGLYALYVLTQAASATHMSGRFIALPAFVLLFVLATHAMPPRAAIAVASAAMLWLALAPLSPLKLGTRFYAEFEQPRSRIDAKLFVHREGAALRSHRLGRRLPDHRWFHAGLAFRNDPARVIVGGGFGGTAMGYFGYAAGPSKHIIDYVALTDPLLARLPACNTRSPDLWKSGHFVRLLPPGYAESVATRANRIEDPALRRYYDSLLVITRGPLFSWERWREIARMNLGLDRERLDPYRKWMGDQVAGRDCGKLVLRQRGPVRRPEPEAKR